MEESISEKTVRATKWSVVTQVASKLISPVTQLVLAHLLAPEAFGVVALVNMVTTFADMFSDAGFQKYLIQHEYGEGEDLLLSADVAFWTNLGVSLMLWAGIALLRDPLAESLGNASAGLAIAVACASLPLTAAVSVQTAVYQRRFDFKTLFYSRMGSATLVFLVSVPLAAVGFGYWSIILGTLSSNMFLAVWLTLQSEWKPAWRYSVPELQRMFSFSAWTLVEAFSIWFTTWVGTMILGTMMTPYYLGLYNTSTSLVNSVVGIVTGAVNPIVFASLSRLQCDRPRFDDAYFRMQKALALAVVPVATALFVFRDMVVGLYLGDQWLETGVFLGLYALASALVVVFGHISSDAYRSLGRPRLSLLSQLIFLLFLVPSLLYGAAAGYSMLSWVVPLFRVVGSLVANGIICGLMIGLSPVRMVANLRWVYIATALVAVPCEATIGILGLGYGWQLVLAAISAPAYLTLVLAIPDLRATALDLAERFGFGEIVRRVLPEGLVSR